jgi:RND superfamily putative drug exporter
MAKNEAQLGDVPSGGTMHREIAGLLTGPRIKYVVVLFWLVLLAIAGPLAGKLMGAEKNDAKSWLPGSAESTQVLDAQAAFVSPNTIPAVLVYERSSGLTPADQAKIAADLKTFSAYPNLDGTVIGPVLSPDGQAAQVIVPINLGPEGWNLAGDVVKQMKATAENGGNGVQIYVTGPAGVAADSASAFEGIDSTLLFATVAVVVLILLFTYRSPILWLLPVISAGVALAVAQAVIYLLAAHAGLTVNAQSAGILTVLVFGAGTDYALLLVARYREELRRHHDRHEAMAVALHRAGPAIVASGATVVVSMLCLLFAQTNSTRGLGPVAAHRHRRRVGGHADTVAGAAGGRGAVGLLAGATVEGSPEPTATGVWARAGATVARAPRLTWIVTVGVLVLLSLGMFQLHATGLTNKESFRGTPASVVGEDALSRHFPAGAGNRSW